MLFLASQSHRGKLHLKGTSGLGSHAVCTLLHSFCSDFHVGQGSQRCNAKVEHHRRMHNDMSGMASHAGKGHSRIGRAVMLVVGICLTLLTQP